jgi:hypothetical protein
MRQRLPIVLSALALLVALLGATPLGEAAGNAVRFAVNADKVDGIHASRTPKANRLLALDSKKRLAAGPTSLALLDGAKCTVGGRQGVAHLSVQPLAVVIPATLTAATNSGAASATLTCLAPDTNEPNNSQAAARSISSTWGCSIVFPGQCAAYAAGSLYPAGDSDWYSFTGHSLSSLSIGGTDPAIQYDVLKNGVAVASNQTTTSVSGAPGDTWLVHVHGPLGSYTLTLSGSP